MNELGIEPAMRVIDPASNSGLLCIILATLMINAFVFPTLLRLWRVFFKQLIRTHSEMPQVERTLNERVALAISLLQTIIMEAIALYCTCAASTDSATHAVPSFCGLLALTASLLLIQIAAYSAIGFAFAAPQAIQSWIRAFFTTQSLAGYFLIIPALGGLFYPESEGLFLIVCVAIFCICRILFYIRSFAFFYTNPASIFYFFLYLCTVEIVPLMTAWSLKGLFFSAFT